MKQMALIPMDSKYLKMNSKYTGLVSTKTDLMSQSLCSYQRSETSKMTLKILSVQSMLETNQNTMKQVHHKMVLTRRTYQHREIFLSMRNRIAPNRHQIGRDLLQGGHQVIEVVQVNKCLQISSSGHSLRKMDKVNHKNKAYR